MWILCCCCFWRAINVWLLPTIQFFSIHESTVTADCNVVAHNVVPSFVCTSELKEILRNDRQSVQMLIAMRRRTHKWNILSWRTYICCISVEYLVDGYSTLYTSNTISSWMENIFSGMDLALIQFDSNVCSQRY